MKGAPEVIDALQTAAGIAAQLATQYRLDSADADYMRLKKVAKKLHKFHKQCSWMLRKIDRHILFLGGSPAYSGGDASTLPTIADVFERARAAETALDVAFNGMAIAAMEAKDDNTRNILEHLIKFAEDDRLDWLEGQLASIAALGLQGYLQITVKV